MNDAPVRSAPVGAYLAIAAGALALLALALPWFSLDMVAFQEMFQRVMRQVTAAGGVDTSLVDSVQGQAFAQIASDRAASEINGNLHGYQDSIGWVAVRVFTVIGGVLAALKILRREVSGASQRSTFIGIGIAFALRPAMNLAHSPFAKYDGQEGMFGITPSELVSPASGLYVALLAAALMIGAGLLAHVGDEVPAPDASVHTAPVSGVHVPGMPAPAQQVHVPVAYVPAGPPQPAQAAHVPAAYVPPAPPQQPAMAAYVPLAPQQPAPLSNDVPRRSSSVAPPGTF